MHTLPVAEFNIKELQRFLDRYKVSYEVETTEEWFDHYGYPDCTTNYYLIFKEESEFEKADQVLEYMTIRTNMVQFAEKELDKTIERLYSETE